MKIQYVVEDTNYGYKKIKLPKEMYLVELVFEDMESFGKPIFLEYIEKVVKGISDFEDVTGNICNLEIRKNMTKISVEFVPDNISNNLLIETNKLLELIKLWSEQNKNFFSSN